MDMPASVEIAVVGAGVIGLTIALRLAAEGHEVVLLDPRSPGSGASYGNAGTLAGYGCIPVGNPGVLRALPQLLLAADSPFALRWAALPQLAPWLLRFMRQSLPGAARANAVAMAGLLSNALASWEDVAVEAEATDLFRANGCLYLLKNDSDTSPADWGYRVRAELGVRQSILTSAEIARLEPGLPPAEGPGLYFEDAVNLTDPRLLMQRLLAAATGKGARHVEAEVTGIEARDGHIALTGTRFTLKGQKVVIAAGARSKALAAQLGDAIPLETERGYHIEFATDTPLLNRPVCAADLGFYMTPMTGRLRVAGTVELGGLEAPLNPKRLALLERGARRYFPGLGNPVDPWLGFRPSLPDSRPIIGPSQGSANVIYAFGHGHLGLTLAAVTARLVADLIGGKEVPERLAPFSAARY